MGFFDELEQLFTADELCSKFRVSLVGDEIVFIIGVKKILEFNAETIIVQGEDTLKFKVVGQGLLITKYEENEIVVSGKIGELAYV